MWLQAIVFLSLPLSQNDAQTSTVKLVALHYIYSPKTAQQTQHSWTVQQVSKIAQVAQRLNTLKSNPIFANKLLYSVIKVVVFLNPHNWAFLHHQM